MSEGTGIKDRILRRLASNPGYTMEEGGLHSYHSRRLENSYRGFVLDPFIKKLTGKKNRSNVLDLACGTGETSNYLEDHDIKVNRLDISEYAFTSQKEADRKVIADASRPLPYGNGSFSGVHIKDTLEHIPDKAKLLQEVSRVLDRGGIALIVLTEWRLPYIRAGKPYFRTKVGNVIKDAEASGLKLTDRSVWVPLHKEIDWYDTEPTPRNLLWFKKE